MPPKNDQGLFFKLCKSNMMKLSQEIIFETKTQTLLYCKMPLIWEEKVLNLMILINMHLKQTTKKTSVISYVVKEL